MAAVRASVIAACAPLIRDVVLCGLDRNFIGALIFPAPGRASSTSDAFRAASRCTSPRPRPAVPTTSPAPSSSTRQPQIDASEVTDKGSINQRAVMAARAADVEALYAEPPPPHVMVFPR